MLNKLTELISNKIIQSSYFSSDIGYALKENAIWLLLISDFCITISYNKHIQINMISAENLSYLSTEHAVNKTNCVHMDKICTFNIRHQFDND